MPTAFTIGLASDARDTESACQAARAFAQGRGATSQEAETTASVLRELVRWVAEACFPPPSTGRIDITLTTGDDGVHVTLRDDGVPLPSFGAGLGPIPEALAPVAATSVDLHMLNEGLTGKTLVCLIPTSRVLGSTLDNEIEQVTASAEDVQTRLATQEDAEAVGRVIHAVYGLAYGNPIFYDPTALRAAWESGAVVSAVGVVHGEVVAHIAFTREPGGDVYEAGAAAVDPRFRSLGLTSAMALAASTEAFMRGASAISAHMVTTHTRSQSGPAKAGFVATGLLLGAAPPAVPGDPRQTLLLAYLPLKCPPRAIATPSDDIYRNALTTLYERLALQLVEQDVEQALREIGDAPGIELRASVGDESPAIVFIRRWGPAEHEALVSALRDAVTARPSMVYVDCDLHTLRTEQLDEIRAFLSYYDFLGAGLMLFEEFGHDHMRLQAMLSRDIQIDQIMLLTDDARAIRAAIFNDHAVLSSRLKETDS